MREDELRTECPEFVPPENGTSLTTSATATLQRFASTRTQAEVAQSLGVQERTVRRWLSGDTDVPATASKLMDALSSGAQASPSEARPSRFTFMDLFAGIGGTRLGFQAAGGRCVYTAEWDKYARKTYAHHFQDGPEHQMAEDITKIDAAEVPKGVDVLVGGFPCQPFSIAGVSKKNALGRAHGFADATQGTLFFDVARIIDAARPRAFLLENVKNLESHDKGKTLKVILATLKDELGYHVKYRVVDASPWVPQGRRRIFIVGFKDETSFDFGDLQPPDDRPTMADILHPESGPEDPRSPYTDDQGRVLSKYTLTDNLWRYLQDYKAKHNAAGNGFGFGLVGPDDVARTLSARYYKDGSEILVSRGEGRNPRRLTPRECARLMGFPEDFDIPVSDTQAYKQFGNSVVVPAVAAAARLMADRL